MVVDPDGVELAAIRELVDLDGLSVVDVGCGEGRLTFACASAGANVFGFDPDEDAIACARAETPRALRGSVRFDEPLHGLGGDRRIDRLQIFRRLEFLGPRRRIRVFLDRTALFFGREEPTELAVTVTWRTDQNERRRRTIRHDLAAFRDFPYLEVPDDA